MRPYTDFKLYLTRPPDAACEVALLPTQEVGESLRPVRVPPGSAPDSAILPYLAAKSLTGRQLVAFGKALGNCLLPEGEIRALFREALKREGGVRLRLILADPALRQWPWEYTYLDLLGGPDSMSGFLALNPLISFVRHEPLPYPHPTVPAAGADLTDLRMLITAALPEGTRSLALAQEVARVTQAVQDFEVDGVRLTYADPLMDTTPDDLARALQAPAYIFHFAGHGITAQSRDSLNRGTVEQGFLLLVSDKQSKQEYRLSAQGLARMLRAAGVRLAVLAGCYSGARSERYPWESVAGALVAAGVPATVAMQYEVVDEQAIEFNRTFYAALASGLSLDEAVSLGRLAMLRATEPAVDRPISVEWGVPVLYSRMPDGALFPERIARAGAAAEEFRKVITQTAGRIERDGVVTGLTVRRIRSGVKVEQRADVVLGELTGIRGGAAEDDASVRVEQKLGTVSGNVTGADFDEI